MFEIKIIYDVRIYIRYFFIKHLYLRPKQKIELFKEVKMEICIIDKTRKNHRCKDLGQFTQQV